MGKKLLIVSSTVIFIILLIGLAFSPTINAMNYKPNMENGNDNFVYVDDDNVDGPWDGTIEHPYKKIKDGIAKAHEGDTVYVFNGQYKETPTVDKSIKLIGEDKRKTIIDGGGRWEVIDVIKCSGVKISGFTIRNGCNILDTDWQIEVYQSNNITISNNIIENGKAGGIRLADVSNSIIMNNIIRKHRSSGLSISGYVGGKACNNIIFGNHFEKNYLGLKFFDGLCYRNFVIKNNFIDNTKTDSTFVGGSLRHFWKNFWINNYWGKPRFFPKIVKGSIYLSNPFPFGYPSEVDMIRFDFFPAKVPYPIEVL